MGHLERASGLAGVLKCVMILEKGVIPPNALFEKLNPKINARRNKIQVPTSCVPWPSSGLRRVSVDSFGFGGSNAHAIMNDVYRTLELISVSRAIHSSVPALPVTNGLLIPMSIDGDSYYDTTSASGMKTYAVPPPGASPILIESTEIDVGSLASSMITAASSEDASATTLQCQLLVYSARDESSLKRVFQTYSKYYDERILGSTSRLQQLAHALAYRRTILPWRSFAVGNAELSWEALDSSDSDRVRASSEANLCFIFTGQAAQYANMGLKLIQYHVFGTTLSKANKVFQTLWADWSVVDKLFLFHILPSYAQIIQGC
ncbi:polyketide synthase PksD [Apiospora sp. TS-2023a]